MDEDRFTLELAESGDVILLIDADRINLGPKDQACETMCRFLEALDFGG